MKSEILPEFRLIQLVAAIAATVSYTQQMEILSGLYLCIVPVYCSAAAIIHHSPRFFVMVTVPTDLFFQTFQYPGIYKRNEKHL